MPRKPKCRKVAFLPEQTHFKPAGIPLKELEEECIRVEELEAIRLKDLEGLEQEICAEKMDVSRATFQRIIRLARLKLAKALVEGKAIRIEGGNYKFNRPKHDTCPYCECLDNNQQNVISGEKHGTPYPPQKGRCPYCGKKVT